MARYIDADALIAEYDRVHIGPAGGARKLMVDAPTADVVEVKFELQILTDTDGEPYMVIAKGNQAKYLVELMQKDEVGTATGRSDT